MTELTSRPPLRSVVRFLGSLTFLILLLSAMLLALILPTIFNQFINPDYGYDRTVGALRRDWYGAWWFNILMFLLMVNLTVCTVIRTPWRFFWMWGFLITHSGILTLMIGAAITFNTKIYGDLQAVEGQSYDYFTIENENEIAVRTSDGERQTFQVRWNPYRPSSEKKSFRMSESSTFIHVEEFLPNVAVEPSYRESPAGGESVAEIAVHLPDQEPRKRFLRLHEPLQFGPLSLRALTISDTAFAALSETPPERPTLALTIAGESRELDIEAEKDKVVRVGDADVTVKRWGTPSERIPDFWVEFTVARANQEPERWFALALEVDQSPLGMSGEKAPDFQARLRRKFTAEDFHGRGALGALYFTKAPSGLKHIFISSKGERASGALAPGTKLVNPFMTAMPMQVELVRWLDRAEETVEETEPRKNRPRNPALRITAESGKVRQTQWVKFFGDPVAFQLGDRRVEVAYRGRQYRDLPFTLGLDDFRVAFNRGTMAAKHFESDLTLTDHETGEVTKQTIEVNTPMKYKGFVIYQASWNPDDRRMSIFQISKDPGKKVLYLGWVMAVSGSIFMFFLKPFLQKLIKTGSKGEDPPLTSMGAMAIFGLITLGTIVGMVAPLVFPRIEALWLGLAVAGADLVLALVVALLARSWRSARPVRALQTGEILAAGWCLNTAALVLLLMMKVTA
jgi:hypothetical protein